jgi:hypothetical protein
LVAAYETGEVERALAALRKNERKRALHQARLSEVISDTLRFDAWDSERMRLEQHSKEIAHALIAVVHHEQQVLLEASKQPTQPGAQEG